VLNATHVSIATGGTLTLMNQGTGNIDGAAAGQGALVFAGNYDTDAALGGTTSLASLMVDDGVTLTLDQDAEATSVTVGQGASGIINHSAGTVAAATLNVSSGATYNQSGTAAINASNIFVTGIFNKSNASITANTTINDGGLMNVLASFTHTGDLTVGQGTSGTLNVTNTTVDVNGSFTLADGATLMTTVNSGAADDAGSITVTGTTTVSANAKVDVTVAAGAVVASGTTYKIIDGPTGGGGVAEPLTITDDSADLDFFATSDGDDLVLNATLAGTLPGIISGVVGEEFAGSFSANAAAVFTDLADLLDNDAELTTAFAGITTAEDFDKALEALAPDMSGAIIDATTAVGRSAVVTIINRLVALRTAATSGALTGMSAGDPYHDVGMWLQGFGSTIDQDNRQGVAGFDADTAGLTFGADTLLTDNFRLGAAFSYASTDVDTKGSSNNVDIDNYQGTVYASLKNGEHYFDASFSYGQNSYTGSRAVTVGTLKRTARSDYDADQTIIQGIWGRRFDIGNGVHINPFIGLNYVNLDIDAYTETGAGAANLVVAKADHETLESSVGLSLRKEMKTDQGTTIIPEIHASWRHECLDDEQTNTSTFTGAGTSFATRGFDPANNSANIGVAFSAYLKNNIDIQVRYDYESKSDYDGHSGIATIRYNF